MDVSEFKYTVKISEALKWTLRGISLGEVLGAMAFDEMVGQGVTLDSRLRYGEEHVSKRIRQVTHNDRDCFQVTFTKRLPGEGSGEGLSQAEVDVATSEAIERALAEREREDERAMGEHERQILDAELVNTLGDSDEETRKAYWTGGTL